MESEFVLQKNLSEMKINRTTFSIAHKLSTIQQADQRLGIEKGQIAERGKHQELLDKKGRYHDLFTYQSRI